jgi:hypothetical protein
MRRDLLGARPAKAAAARRSSAPKRKKRAARRPVEAARDASELN